MKSIHQAKYRRDPCAAGREEDGEVREQPHASHGQQGVSLEVLVKSAVNIAGIYSPL
jgi:hypothetical protein